VSQRFSLLPGAPAPETDCLAALRLATKELHARLDASLPLGRDDATLEDYRHHTLAVSAWLMALHPYLSTLEPLAPGFRFADPARLDALQQDARDAHGGHSTPDADEARISDSTRALADQAFTESGTAGQTAASWGMAYVVEGSQLGGQLLYRRLGPRLAPHPLRYLQGAGLDTGARWKRFTTLLNANVHSDFDVRMACAGARAGFEGLQRVFQEHGVFA